VTLPPEPIRVTSAPPGMTTVIEYLQTPGPSFRHSQQQLATVAAWLWKKRGDRQVMRLYGATLYPRKILDAAVEYLNKKYPR
jgi:hypothetical protein